LTALLCHGFQPLASTSLKSYSHFHAIRKILADGDTPLAFQQAKAHFP
jgi:hypothetical protein